MGRHSSGENNYSLSKGAIATLIAITAIIAIAVWFFFVRDDTADTNAQPDCVSGDLTLPIAAVNQEVARPIVDKYAESQPVVRDYCVQPELVDDIAAAAVVVAPDSPLTDQALEDASRAASTSEREAAAAERVGLTAGSPIQNPEAVTAEDVDYSAASDAAVAATVATVLTDTPEQARTALETTGGAYQAATESGSGENFAALGDSQVVYSAIPLAASDGVSEDQARAGSDFAEFAAEAFEGGQEAVEIDPAVWTAAAEVAGGFSAASPNPSSGVTESSADGEAIDTLFLLDTSLAMDPYVNSASRAVGEAANAVIDEGHEVALWNYSSPLNPGVTKSWRSNVQFTSKKDAVGQSAAGLGVGGQSNTREAVRAAVEAVAGFDEDVRIVVMTAGTSDAGSDEAYVSALEPLLAQGVSLSVVHVGDAPADDALARLATSATTVDAAGDIPAAVQAAAEVN
ncbi:vWA domain-containing protein [Corynebacterium pilosum]|uniref:Putative secreted protein n=1 Tax=Corynebacterium pilosum TaxID=35756 RepID=A0A376CQ67_9CORY|nr:vWA domain-containing protein [Corynebacterium pilosum]STC70412.1 putative secreted protein [Corynebacterium pilosum]